MDCVSESVHSRDVEKLFTQLEIEGESSLKIDLSLIKPIIIMPRSSHRIIFLELDILHVNIRSTSEWYGGSKYELGAVHLETMTLEIEDLHLVVGVRGQTGEGIIQERGEWIFPRFETTTP
jgi:vacuolar protein sorting-associated protein 13A/C